jgi:hypothetical protein
MARFKCDSRRDQSINLSATLADKSPLFQGDFQRDRTYGEPGPPPKYTFMIVLNFNKSQQNRKNNILKL